MCIALRRRYGGRWLAGFYRRSRDPSKLATILWLNEDFVTDWKPARAEVAGKGGRGKGRGDEEKEELHVFD